MVSFPKHIGNIRAPVKLLTILRSPISSNFLWIIPIFALIENRDLFSGALDFENIMFCAIRG